MNVKQILYLGEDEKTPAPLPEEGTPTADQGDQEEQSLNIIREDSQEQVSDDGPSLEFESSSRRSSLNKPETLVPREYSSPNYKVKNTPLKK